VPARILCSLVETSSLSSFDSELKEQSDNFQSLLPLPNFKNPSSSFFVFLLSFLFLKIYIVLAERFNFDHKREDKSV
jgi:hypothetical protein